MDGEGRGKKRREREERNTRNRNSVQARVFPPDIPNANGRVTGTNNTMTGI